MLERIGQFIESLNISVRAFEVKIGASNGLIRKALANKTDIQAKWVLIIAENYPQLNLNWLFTGIGPMLRDEQPDQPTLPPPLPDQGREIALLENMLADKDKIIASQDKTIARDEELIASLKQRVRDIEKEHIFHKEGLGGVPPADFTYPLEKNPHHK